ncbi:unnamed protein product [Acanthosepion pharaonis]|uniref:Uncharacterized protein n=1 Tax=Acanthosepion pharaonis TaxID=158019 RepID=A0A812D0G5_ACAPH|nr:unnamed protein product [Sepia pharaonis]
MNFICASHWQSKQLTQPQSKPFGHLFLNYSAFVFFSFFHFSKFLPNFFIFLLFFSLSFILCSLILTFFFNIFFLFTHTSSLSLFTTFFPSLIDSCFFLLSILSFNPLPTIFFISTHSSHFSFISIIIFHSFFSPVFLHPSTQQSFHLTINLSLHRLFIHNSEY